MIKKWLTRFGKALLLTLVCLSVWGLLGCTQTTTSPVYPYQGGVMGPGGMMGSGGMMNPGGGMMGPGGPYRSGSTRLTLDKANSIAQDYIQKRNDPNLQIKEFMEFQYNFYAEVFEKNSGIGAFEALIDPYTGDMYPEPGPNMMWNTKYGTMSGMVWGVNAAGPMTVTEDQAKKAAQDFLNGYLPGVTTEEPDRFYGYYTLHILKDGKMYGMLSVNGYTGQVWFHSWHGPFIDEK
jgi:hypothetical protein